MDFDLRFAEEYMAWFVALTDVEKEEIRVILELLHQLGHDLIRNRQYVGSIKDSKFRNMKELIVQIHGDPFRIFFAFDPKRNCIVLCGGCKTGKNQKRWYKKMIKLADELYSEYLEQ